MFEKFVWEKTGKLCDLHTHTVCSDGSMTPAELVDLAKNIGINYLALTDHETIDGVDEANERAQQIGINFIPGVELSANCDTLDIECKRGTSLHILGYFSMQTIHNLDLAFKMFERERLRRTEIMIDKMSRTGIDIDYKKIVDFCNGGIITRGKLAEYMMVKGFTDITNVREAINKYFELGMPFYVEKQEVTPKNCIEIIKQAGGVCVIAHPALLNIDMNNMDKFCSIVKSMGVDGIEAIYVENTEQMTRDLINLANKYELIVTGGSDFHGKLKPKIKLGKGFGDLFVPESIGVDLFELVRKR